jgi:non-specific serine/threonine protein kinase
MGQMSALVTRLPPLVGRREALAQTKKLLARGALLTLTGPGGCGKTRLALETAREAGSAYPGGVWVVELAPLHEPTAIPEVAAAALGLRVPPGVAAVDWLLAFLRPREALMVCDNCEHLLPDCVEFIEMLLAACPRLRILATSRETLNSALEVTWAVPPLSVPDLAGGDDTDTATASEAVQLFVQRATMTLPDFALTEANAGAIGRICQHLDGLPLAIELAVGCVNTLSPDQIAARIERHGSFHLLGHGYRTASPRHRSLEATMAWSYRLLTPAEQALFRRVSVLAGTFELGVAVAVDGGPPDAVLDCLRQLIAKSLVVAVQCEGEVRYSLLETLRQYGRERLRAAGEEHDIFTRYCAWVTGLIDATALTGRDQVGWLDRCEREVAHLRVALGWMLEQQQVEVALRLATSLLTFWRQRGRICEGRRWLETALAADRQNATISPILRARALNGLGVLSMWQGHDAQAQACHEGALSLFDALDHQPGVAQTLSRLGFLADRRGHYQTATAHLEQSLAICSSLDDPVGVDMARNRLGIVAWNQGDYGRATSLLEESLQFRRGRGHVGECACTLLNLGTLALERGDADRASALLRESLALNQGLHDHHALTYVHTYLGYAALHGGEPPSSAQAFGDALALVADGECDHELVFRLLDGVAALAARRGEGASAAHIWGAMDALRGTHALAYRPIEWRRYRDEVAAARRTVDRRAFAQAWREGRAESLADALNEARTVLSQLAAKHAEERASAPVDTPLGDTGETVGGRAKPLVMHAEDPGFPAEDPVFPMASTSDHVPDVAAPSVKETCPRLRVRALGQVQASRDERSITATELTYSKARELLHFLLRHAPSTKEQIGLALWPDATSEYLQTTFRVVVHHLRRALGPEAWIVREHQYYTFNRSLPYWYDVEAFEASAAEARRLLSRAPERSVECLEVADALYRGDFWEGMTMSEWIAQEQGRIRRSYLDVLLSLGELYMRYGAVRQALGLFLRASERDPYCEEAHRGVMRCYLELHEPGRAAQHFERLRLDLKEQLGLEPAAETAALVRVAPGLHG